MKINITILAAVAAATGVSSAATIGVNFTESIAGHANQQIASGTVAGSVPQSNWNNTGGATGTINTLADSAGVATTASITWTSGGVWGDGDANADANAGVGDAQLNRGYWDDNNGGGQTFTVTGVPYTNYDLLVYYATDTPGTQHLQGITANGTFGRPDITTGARYSEKSGAVWDSTNTATITGLTGDLTATMDLRNANGNGRATIAGFQILEASAIPEPSSTLLVGLSGLALLMRRRR
ncbi:MAG: PEP-CTERM sorting domain-containing protein [Akkermansiaceae bacterium]|nr:PEP-CTERM sorting domain-containing protein [Akkermansiaceae bacterium]MDG2324804.1 PEP-CTERM sorting domain-containing protein [Akkermansiaceae bacterium]